MPKTRAQEESAEILRQLGGNKFQVMTGAKNFGYSVDKNGNTNLQFKIGRNCKNVNQVSITVNGLDLYDLEFLNVRLVTKPEVELKKKIISAHQNIFCEDLRNIFENSTGLCTSLGSMGR